MRVAISLRLATEDWEQGSAYVVEASGLGAHSVWTPEAWGHDAVSPLASSPREPRASCSAPPSCRRARARPR